MIFIHIYQADEAISDFREPLTTADYCQVIARKAKPHGVRRAARRNLRRAARRNLRRAAVCAASHMSSRLRPQHTCARPPLVRCRVTVRKRLRGEVVRKLVKQGFSRTSVSPLSPTLYDLGTGSREAALPPTQSSPSVDLSKRPWVSSTQPQPLTKNSKGAPKNWAQGPFLSRKKAILFW